MDYTTVERVKQEMHIVSGSSMDDALLALLVTSASRAWDRFCTGSVEPDTENYFARETVTDEVLTGQIDYKGERIICYPHKPVIHSVTSFTYQKNIVSTAYAVTGSRIECAGAKLVAYPDKTPTEYPTRCRVTVTYDGGLATSGSGMPADMQEAVAILVARFYREAETGLSDQIGVAELSTMIYTRAMPVRVSNILEFYKRRVGWRYVA